MKTLSNIRETLMANKLYLYQKYSLKRMAIFGSYARNEQEKESDVDIIVEFDKEIGIEFIDLAEELETILGTKVDLISKGGIKEKYYKVIQPDLIYV